MAAEALLADMRPSSPSAAPGQNMLPPNTRQDVAGHEFTSPIWRAGAGPATLFVHGWDDTHRVWRRFAQDFLQKQRPLLLMDLPGHGASKAESCHWPQAGRSVTDVCAAQAPIDTIIAHSFGGIATARAIALGARADFVVLIAPPLDRSVSGWTATQRRNGVSEAIISKAASIYQERTGFEIEGFDLAQAMEAFEGKVLFIGSDADERCPLAPMYALAEQLTDARVIEANGLSHRDLALDMDVLRSILDFLGYD